MSKDFSELFERAHQAGMRALCQAQPTPMVVTEADVLTGQPLPNARRYFVEGGACGFASVVVKPGNAGFARWLVQNRHGRKHYYGGVAMSVQEGGQSLERKEAYAREFAKVIEEAQVVKSVYVDSRMD